MKKALVLYPHQLFPADTLPDVDVVYLVEDPLFFGTDQELPRNIHKQKLILHRASMRRYTEEVLWQRGLDVEYIEQDAILATGEILDKLSHIDQIFVFDPLDDMLATRLLQARRERPKVPEITFLPHPNFYLKEHEVRQYFAERHKHVFSEFYQWQRERFNILIGEDYKPLGGAWMLAKGPGQPYAKEQALPSFAVYGSNKWVVDATKYIEKHFPENPGSTDFIWPTSHEEASSWVRDFVENRLDGYAQYVETLDSKAAWLHHSALSSSLNIGLLSPQEVIAAALARHRARPVPLESLELFIRQILGQREFMRGMYLARSVDLGKQNTLRHQRKLTAAWYNGTLGIPPFDDLVKKLQDRAYAHQSERAYIAGALMLLCEIHPDAIRRWFHELFIDSYDWVLLPNLALLSQFIDEDMTMRPCIGPSNTLLQISDYERGLWSDVWDGLFWRFVEKHKAELQHNPQLRSTLQRLGRLDADRKRIIQYRAEDFLNTHTQL